MTRVFADMTSEEAERFMLGNDHPMRKIAAGMVGSRPVVDLGCGRGIDVSELYTKEQYKGLDCSWELLKIAKRDNPNYDFRHRDILPFLGQREENQIHVGVMISVLEHVESLELAQAIYIQARRACKELLIGWHCPPHYSTTEIIQVQAELKSPINQNHYAEGTFYGAIRITPVLGGELWSVRG